MSFSKNEKWVDLEEIASIKDHASSHIFVMDGKNFIFGRNRKYQNLAHFGGLPDINETVVDTAIREFQEESLNTIVQTERLQELIKDPSCSKVSFAQSFRNGKYSDHYCFFLSSHFDFDGSKSLFESLCLNPDLTVDQKENDKLIIVPYSHIEGAISHLIQQEIVTFNCAQNIYVQDKDGNSYLLRNYTIFPLICWFKSKLSNL